MDLIRIEECDGVSVVSLNDGKANTLGREMVASLDEAVHQLWGSRGGVVLTGTGRFFSAGLDLELLSRLDTHELTRFVDAFEEMVMSWFTLGRPVVAAINGHAIAGGTVLALAADVRLVARAPLKMGLTEVSLGIPLPAAALDLTLHAVDPSRAARVLLAGEACDPERAVDMGLADEIVDPAELLERSIQLARRLGATPGRAYALTKSALRSPTVSRFQSRRAGQRDVLVTEVTSPEVRSALETWLSSLKNRRS